MKPALICALLVASGWAFGSETFLLNRSPAQDCFLATRDGGSPSVNDLEVCTTAIEHQMLVPVDLAATYSNRGILHARLGDYSAALKDHNRAHRLAPELASIYINRSNTLVAVRRYEDALQDLENAIAIADAALPIAHYNRALMFKTLGDTEAARADAERAAELAPDSEAYRRFIEDLVR